VLFVPESAKQCSQKTSRIKQFIAGHTVLCTVAGQLLGDLTATESDAAFR
jgi:hypothetical protein